MEDGTTDWSGFLFDKPFVWYSCLVLELVVDRLIYALLQFYFGRILEDPDQQLGSLVYGEHILLVMLKVLEEQGFYSLRVIAVSLGWAGQRRSRLLGDFCMAWRDSRQAASRLLPNGEGADSLIWYPTSCRGAVIWWPIFIGLGSRFTSFHGSFSSLFLPFFFGFI